MLLGRVNRSIRGSTGRVADPELGRAIRVCLREFRRLIPVALLDGGAGGMTRGRDGAGEERGGGMAGEAEESRWWIAIATGEEKAAVIDGGGEKRRQRSNHEEHGDLEKRERSRRGSWRRRGDERSLTAVELETERRRLDFEFAVVAEEQRLQQGGGESLE